MVDPHILPTVPASARPDKRERLKQLVNQYGVNRSKDGIRIFGTNGEPNSWLMDLRAVFMQPDALELMAELFWERYAAKAPLQVAGMEVAAIPMVIAIMLKAQQLGLSCNGLIIRKERKTTGLGRILEGTPNTNPVVVVDDLANSGSSLSKVQAVLAKENLPVSEFFVVVDFLSSRGLRWRAQPGVPPITGLFTLPQFDLKLNNDRPAPPVVAHYTPLWRYAAAFPNPHYVVPKSAPVWHQGKLIFGSDSATVHAVDALTGGALWHFQMEGAHRKGIFGTAAVHEDKVFIGGYNGNLYCLNANTGAQYWFNPCCEWIGSSPLVVPQHNLVYVGLEYAKPRASGSVAAFDLNTGEKRWESWLQVVQHGSGAYCGLNDTVIFGTNDHTVVSYAATTGAIQWIYDLPRSAKYAPVVDNTRGLCAFTSWDGGIYLIDALTGQTKWRVGTGNICYTTPLIVGDTLFAGSGDQHFYAIDIPTGEVKLKLNMGARVYGNPQFIPPHHVIVGATNGRVLELDVNTLQQTGWLSVPDGIVNRIMVLDDGQRIVVPTYQNELYCYERRLVTT
ncbi:MAG: PQQ-binding-like beta-propeller repeat protein [Alphaproteobacteria bacterium]|nr:PQQ-binding-like beta-propeller repeat protein [Alphaproteobacteria bacterium]